MAAHADVKLAAAAFCADLKQECDALTQTLGQPNADRTAVLTRLSIALKSLTEATVFLPAYDQRACAAMLKTISDQLTTAAPARAKFTFASRKAKSSTPAAGPPESAQPLAEQRLPPPQALPPAALAPRPTARQICSNRNCYIAPPPVPISSAESSTSSDVEVADLTRCVVSLLDLHVGALHLKNLDRCVLVVGPIAGSVLVESCRNCVFVICCRQLRIHNSVGLAIPLHIASHPIIEDCSALRFGLYPRAALADFASVERFEAARIDPNPGASAHKTVEDFCWLKRGQSPNWVLMSSDDEHACGTEAMALATSSVVDEQALMDSLDALVARFSVA
ncbi:hypothetical protein HDU87_006455 [Geranomyces variabilis]|uniref:C-CAP/cofactor C-like domain-containing protein n=1 Tax=Geranomyces variabilis TaxID=109894 RepID=A0AAD5TF89_9FUNG|nr:hypothetical protein HDU87_006455 [Geranomyces variabilis]